MIITFYIMLKSVIAPKERGPFASPSNYRYQGRGHRRTHGDRQPGMFVIEERSAATREPSAEPRLVRTIGRVSAALFEAFAA